MLHPCGSRGIPVSFSSSNVGLSTFLSRRKRLTFSLRDTTHLAFKEDHVSVINFSVYLFGFPRLSW